MTESISARLPNRGASAAATARRAALACARPLARIHRCAPAQRWALLWLLALALAAPACGGDGDSDVVIEAGTSNQDGTSFVQVPDGTEVTLEPGAQGGFHIWLNLRVRGISGRLFVEREARRAVDGALVFRGLRQAIDIAPAAVDDWWESPAAAPAFMCPSPIGIQVYDEPLVFAIRLLDADDQVLASDELALVPRCPEDAQADFCRDICAG
ncbi:MAG: hypothetical protein Tsb0020_22830 [Haliangiales bacterium]